MNSNYLLLILNCGELNTDKKCSPKNIANILFSKMNIYKKYMRTVKNMKTVKNRRRHKWSRKYKLSINCRRPKGFSQKQYCKYGRKSEK